MTRRVAAPRNYALDTTDDVAAVVEQRPLTDVTPPDRRTLVSGKPVLSRAGNRRLRTEAPPSSGRRPAVAVPLLRVGGRLTPSLAGSRAATAPSASSWRSYARDSSLHGGGYARLPLSCVSMHSGALLEAFFPTSRFFPPCHWFQRNPCENYETLGIFRPKFGL